MRKNQVGGLLKKCFISSYSALLLNVLISLPHLPVKQNRLLPLDFFCQFNRCLTASASSK